MENSRRSSLRVSVSKLTDLHCWDEGGRELGLVNVSSAGLGMSSDSWNPLWKENEILNFKISIGGADFGVSARLAHRGTTSFGASLIDPSPEFKKALERFIEAEIGGAELEMVNPKYLRLELQEKVLWLQSKRGTEIYLVKNEDGHAIKHLRMKLLGNVVEWSVESGRVFYWDQNYEFGADENELFPVQGGGPTIADFDAFRSHYLRMIEVCQPLPEQDREKIREILK
jgi:hypothetical protein